VKRCRTILRISTLLTFNHFIRAALSVLRERTGIGDTAKSKWDRGIPAEVAFWDERFHSKTGPGGLQWVDTYGLRLDPDLPLQKYVRDLLPQSADVRILDVGAGPLTYLGKKCNGKRIHITAVDPLADEYDRILARHHVEPPVRTQKLDAEKLTSQFPANTFDLVFAHDCIDHSYDPERAILEMIKVVKTNCYVLLDHRPHTAERLAYKDLHQWNFSVNAIGEFVIGSKHFEVNMNRKYSRLCSIACEMESSGDRVSLITRIRKT